MENAIHNSHKSRQLFNCEKCDYKCVKKSDYKKHINSKKHNAIKCYTNANENSLFVKSVEKIINIVQVFIDTKKRAL